MSITVPVIRPSEVEVPYSAIALNKDDDSHVVDLVSRIYGQDDEGNTQHLEYVTNESVQELRAPMPPFIIPDSESTPLKDFPLTGPFSYLTDRDYFGPQSIGLNTEPSAKALLNRFRRLNLLDRELISEVQTFCQRRNEGMTRLIHNLFGINAQRLGVASVDAQTLIFRVETDENSTALSDEAKEIVFTLLWETLTALGITYSSRDMRKSLQSRPLEVSREVLSKELCFASIESLCSSHIDERLTDLKKRAGIRNARITPAEVNQEIYDIVNRIEFAVRRSTQVGVDLLNHLLLALKVYYYQPETDPVALETVREMVGKWAGNLTLVRMAFNSNFQPANDGTAELLHWVGKACDKLSDLISTGLRVQQTPASELASYIKHEVVREEGSDLPVMGRVTATSSPMSEGVSLYYMNDTYIPDTDHRRQRTPHSHEQMERGEERAGSLSDDQRAILRQLKEEYRNDGPLTLVGSTFTPIPHGGAFLSSMLRADLIYNEDFVWREIQDMVTEVLYRDRSKLLDRHWSPPYMVSVPNYLMLEAAAIEESEGVRLLLFEDRTKPVLIFTVRDTIKAPPQWDPIMGTSYLVGDPLTVIMLKKANTDGKPLSLHSLDFLPSADAHWYGSQVEGEFSVNPLIRYVSSLPVMTLLHDELRTLRFTHDLTDVLASFTDYAGSDGNRRQDINQRIQQMRNEVVAPARPDLAWKANNMTFHLQVLRAFEEQWSDGAGVGAAFVWHMNKHREERFFNQVLEPGIPQADESSIFHSIASSQGHVGTRVRAFDQQNDQPLYEGDVYFGYTPYAYLRNMMIARSERFPAVLNLLVMLAVTFGMTGLSFGNGGQEPYAVMGNRIEEWIIRLARERVTLNRFANMATAGEESPPT